ncbi:MAG: glycine zipper 2TM domain-containing protein [Chromatiales bacterium]|jgi:outer membrane lipoprotein SlyB
MDLNRSVKTVGAALAAGVLAVSIGGCASSMSGSAYPRSQARTVQDVQMGYVESVREVRIEGTKSGVGTIGGAALGGIAGSKIGSGTRANTAGAIGGAVVGGLAGAAAEEGITRRTGLEITVRLDSGRVIAVTQAADQPFYPGDRVRVITGPDGTARVTR